MSVSISLLTSRRGLANLLLDMVLEDVTEL